MFCEKCGSILFPRKEGKKTIMACSHCKFKKEQEEFILTEKVKETEELQVIEEGAQTHLPLVDIECPKCQNKKARFWTVQTRASDEPETKFFKCEKCNHTWRDYD